MPTQRNVALDRFRGWTIICMVVVNDLCETSGVPRFLTHAIDGEGMTFADIIAPFFIFAIAVTYRASFMKRLAKGNAYDTYFHFIGRYLALVGLGTIFTGGGLFETWGVLQAIGLAGLLTLLVIKLPTWARLLISLGMLAAYQVASNLFIGDMIFEGDHGSIIGAISWGAMLILSTAMVDFYNKGLKVFLPATGILAAVGVGSAFIVDISKNRVSASYVLVTVALACAVYWLFNLLSDALPIKPGLVTWWGKNPMLLYVLHDILMGIDRVPFLILDIDPRPFFPAVLITPVLLAALTFIAWALHKKDKRVVF